MDEFTSIFYAPAEAYRFIGSTAIVFIAITSILIRFLSPRFTEIAEIQEHHGLIGGGVYSFSYLVLSPLMSFALIRVVDHELTDRDVTIYFGWPMSSWLDRMAIGVMVFNLMRLPRVSHRFSLVVRYHRR
jgi:hypothetical protein